MSTTKQKVREIQDMLPHLDKDLIEDVLLSNKGDTEKTIDALLAMGLNSSTSLSSEKKESQKKNEASKEKQSTDSSKNDAAKAYLRSSGHLKNSTTSLKSSQNISMKSSGEYEDDEYEDDDMQLYDEDDGIFTPDGKPAVFHNPDVNPNDIDKEIAFLPPVHELTALNVLNPIQTKALTHVVSQSKELSEKIYPTVLEKVKKMGYNEKQLKRTLHYIRDEAPIIIHINCDKVLDFLCKDTFYRNQFETKTSGGYLHAPSRVQWENRLFGSIYKEDCNGFDRVKYGVLNIVNDPVGVKCCSSYGDSYLLLRNVRLRTTFADKDSSNGDTKLACCEYYTHVLNSYSDPELQAVMDVANGVVKFKDSTVIVTYKEVQIHGPVDLSKDVEALVVHSRHKGQKNITELADKFCIKNKCNLIWMK